MKKLRIKQKVILILFGLCVSIVFIETGLRMGGLIFKSLQEYRNPISIKNKGAYRIMCLGESTTALGGKNAYPSQLEEILNQHNLGIKFDAINRGIPGTNTSAMLEQLKYHLNQYTPDMVIVMAEV